MKPITSAEMRENFKHYNEVLHRQEEERIQQRARFLENQKRAHQNREAIKLQAASLPDGLIMLGCGHPAIVGSGKIISFSPSCIACDPIAIVEAPDLAGRIALCQACKHRPPAIAPSSFDLPFFRYCKDRPNDEYACGCW